MSVFEVIIILLMEKIKRFFFVLVEECGLFLMLWNFLELYLSVDDYKRNVWKF